MNDPSPPSWFLEWSEGTWELFTLRGSKGRTRRTLECSMNYPDLRARALKDAQKRGAVLIIRTPKNGREVHDFSTPAPPKD